MKIYNDMNTYNVIEAYNTYIAKRRKEVHVDSDATLQFDVYMSNINEHQMGALYQIFYVYNGQKTLIFSYKGKENIVDEERPFPSMTALNIQFLSEWINFFSEFEDLIIDGKQWKI